MRTDIERINAFLDGELDSRARAALMADVAADPALARELSVLSRLKASVEESIDMPDHQELSERAGLPDQETRQGGFPRLLVAAAAVVVLMLAAGAFWYFSPPQTRGDIPVAWAMEAHRSWDAPYPKNIKPVLRPANVRADAVVPDLSANGLEVSFVDARSTDRGVDSLLVGYRGTRGCKVTMLVLPAPKGLGDMPLTLETGSVRAVAWAAGSLGYFVLAEGMAMPRFRLVAASIQKASLEHLPFDDRTRVALAESRRQSRPCQA